MMKKISLYIFFFISLFCLNRAMAEQATLSGEVTSGSTDNLMSIRIYNGSDAEVSGVKVKVFSIPGILQDFNIKPAVIKKIAPGTSEVFNISFGVIEEIKKDQKVAVEFHITADKGRLDTDIATLDLMVLHENKSAPVTLYLVKTETKNEGHKSSEYEYNYTKNDIGGSCKSIRIPNSWGRYKNYTVQMGFTKIPLKIILGEPFQLHGKVAIFSSFIPKEHECNPENIGGETEHDKWWCLTGGNSFDSPAGELGVPDPNIKKGYRINLPGITNFTISFVPKECEIQDGVISSVPCEGKKGKDIITSGTHFFGMRYEYDISTNLEGTGSNYSYAQTFGISTDKIVKYMNRDGFVELPGNITKKELDGLKRDIEKSSKEFTLRMNKLNLETFLYYKPVIKGEKYLTSVEPYQFPDVSEGTKDTLEKQKASKVDAKKHSNVQNSDRSADRTNTDNIKTVHDQNAKPKMKSDINKDVNPNDPATAAIIKEWISAAEPPINATGGANARYESFGRVVGKIVGGIGKVTGKPDDTAGRTPEKYVWDKRNKMDSVDHCTLGEYVAAKLGNKSIALCKGRYKPKVSDVIGMKAKQARTKFKDLGLKTKISLGSPAPTKETALTVEKTIPAIGSTVDRGAMVTIVVHPPFIDVRTVPNLKGLTEKELMKKIKDAGLVPRITKIKASSLKQSGKASIVNPLPGTEVVAGTIIYVDVFDTFDDLVVVPNVIGLSIKQAAEKIKKAGLEPIFKLSDRTNDHSKDKTIIKQVPKDGSKIIRSTKVEMFVLVYKTRKGTIAESGSTKSVLGDWSWFNGGIVTLKSSGVIVSGGKQAGTYKCVSNDCELTWYGGKYLDKLTLSSDGQKLDGKNQNGTHVWGKRVEGKGTTSKRIIRSGINSDDSKTTIFVDTIDSFGKVKNVPNVIGFSVKEAAQKIKSAGFQPAFSLGLNTNDPKKDKTIARQIPEAGEKLAPGSKIKMFVLIFKTRSKTITDLSDDNETGISLPKRDGTDNKIICDQYYNRLNQLIKRQQQISSKMISNPGNTSDYACQALELGQETIALSKKARSSGCKIDGNLEQASRIMMQTYSQMCQKGIGIQNNKTKINSKQSSGISGEVYYDPNMPVRPEQCPQGIFGSVGPECMSDADYQKALDRYHKKMRDYNSRN